MTADVLQPIDVKSPSTHGFPGGMKIWVTGASGLLGRAVYRHFKSKGFQVIGTAFSRSSESLIKLDLTDRKATEAFIQSTRPNVILHCAAERRPDQVARNPKDAENLNVTATQSLAELCLQFSLSLVYISTDYVFDGTKKPDDAFYEVNDAPHPLNLYGRLKWAGEQVVQMILDQSIILRVPVLYGPTVDPSESAINGLLNTVLHTESIAVDHLQVRYPTHVDDVASVLEQLLLHQPFPKGVFQYSTHDSWTKFSICQFFGEVLGHSTSHLVPSTKEDPTRPAHVHLSTQKLHDLGIHVPPTCFKTWFTSYLKEQLFQSKQQQQQTNQTPVGIQSLETFSFEKHT